MTFREWFSGLFRRRNTREIIFGIALLMQSLNQAAQEIRIRRLDYNGKPKIVELRKEEVVEAQKMLGYIERILRRLKEYNELCIEFDGLETMPFSLETKLKPKSIDKAEKLQKEMESLVGEIDRLVDDAYKNGIELEPKVLEAKISAHNYIFIIRSIIERSKEEMEI